MCYNNPILGIDEYDSEPPVYRYCRHVYVRTWRYVGVRSWTGMNVHGGGRSGCSGAAATGSGSRSGSDVIGGDGCALV